MTTMGIAGHVISALTDSAARLGWPGMPGQPGHFTKVQGLCEELEKGVHIDEPLQDVPTVAKSR